VEEKRSELKAGIVIIVSVAVLTAMLMSVGGYRDALKPKRMLTVELKDIQGVTVNDPVFYAGVKIGTVKKIETVTRDVLGPDGKPKAGEDGKPLKQIYVRLWLEVLAEGFDIREGTTARPLRTMTGITMVEITPGSGPIVPAGEVTKIEGAETATLEQLYTSVKARLDQIKDILDALKSVLGKEQQQHLRELIANLKDSSLSVKTLVKKLADIVNENRPRISNSMRNIEKASGNIARFTDEQYDNASQLVTNLKEASTEVRGTIKRINAVVDSGSKFMADINNIIEENRETVNSAFISARNTAANLEAMSTDLRAHPWLLLNRPTDEEIVVRDAAEVTRQLRQACEKLDKNLEKLLRFAEKEGRAGDVAEIISNLKQTTQAIRANQEKFDKVLKKAGK